jgi:hypothetical protein
MAVHLVSPWNTEASQPQLPRFGPDGQPIESSHLALQLPTCFEMRPLSGGLVSSAPERPCDDVWGLDALSGESGGDAADFLD